MGRYQIVHWYIFNLLILEQMSLIYCGIRNDEDSVKTTKYNSTIVQNMPGTIISFHPTNKSTYFVGTKIGLVIKVYCIFISLENSLEQSISAYTPMPIALFTAFTNVANLHCNLH